MKGWTKLSVAALFVLFSGPAVAQIAGSPHDLSSGLDTNPDNNEICVYCHTPHGARPASEIEAPLWNKPESTAPGGYTTYDSTTLDGDVITVGSVSIACLTCHDGTQAMDAVINAPGSGLSATGASPTNINGGVTIGTLITNLGTDLTNDHPIGIQYGGFEPTAGSPIDPDFNSPQSATIGGGTRWWVDTSVGAAGSRDKTDMILYTRDNTGNGGAAEEPFVECGSCHDPHVGNGTGAAGGNATSTADLGSDVNFMRIANVNSDVCLACHVK